MLADEHVTELSFPSPPYLPAQEYRIAKRGGWKLDNGYCPGTQVIAFFSGLAPTEQAKCYPNEVSVPVVTGLHISDARERLAAKPLGVDPIGIPAKAGHRPGLVVRQEPRPGQFASAASSVRLWITRPDPRFGVFPNLVGSSLADAKARLRKLKPKLKVKQGNGPVGVILSQSPAPGVAAGRRMTVTLVVGS